MLTWTRIIDKRAFLDLIDSDKAHLAMIIELFKEQSQDNLENMENAASLDDSDAFLRAAHDLKNLGRNIAAMALIKHSETLEEHAARQELTKADAMLKETRKLLSKALRELTSIQKNL